MSRRINLYEHEREDEIFLHVRMESWNRTIGKGSKRFVYHARRAKEDIYMRVLSHLQRHGPTLFHVLWNIIETTEPQSRKWLSEMVHFGLVTETRQISEKKWAGTRLMQSTFSMTSKGELYLTKMRALWDLIDAKREPEAKQQESRVEHLRGSTSRRTL